MFHACSRTGINHLRTITIELLLLFNMKCCLLVHCLKHPPQVTTCYVILYTSSVNLYGYCGDHMVLTRHQSVSLARFHGFLSNKQSQDSDVKDDRFKQPLSNNATFLIPFWCLFLFFSDKYLPGHRRHPLPLTTMAQFGGQKNPPWATQFAATAVSQPGHSGQSLDLNSLHCK